jgi:hypothetical protein
MEGCSPRHGYIEEVLHTLYGFGRACQTRLEDGCYPCRRRPPLIFETASSFPMSAALG